MLGVGEIFEKLWQSCAFKRESLSIINQDLCSAQGFVLAQDIVATRPLPPFDNSAMDGYAVRIEDAGKEVKLAGRTLAGESNAGFVLTQGVCHKVMTGSLIPRGTQAVVPIEQVIHSNEHTILLPADVKDSQNIRFAGEEIALDSVILPKGKRLGALDLGLIASQGLSHIKVYKKPKIALFSSGDEVIEPGEVALDHQIYNTNATTLRALFAQYHHESCYKGILPDDRQSLREILCALGEYDIVVTTGGASVGDADLLKATLHELGAEFIFDGVNLKPGKHLSIALLGESIFIMLPGNPLASLLHVYTIILSFLEFCAGASKYYLKAHIGCVDCDVALRNGVQTLLLGEFRDGVFYVFNRGKFGSSALINVWKNNAIALMDENYVKISAKESIRCLLFDNDFEEECRFINTRRSL
ncbi:MAG: molybdopterin molybdotransferase MoeA [Helicobacter sp.]|uniref:molybdopterin molybdotransferase MoeA n=1 Tax=Helicobacter sp. TaxID=218 RepID=UPI002A7949E7|nr:molybdopterin molybdotransferase MoeA [Helicobacter sp.]